MDTITFEHRLADLAAAITRLMDETCAAADAVRPAVAFFVDAQPPGSVTALAFAFGEWIVAEANALLEQVRDLTAGIAAPAMFYVYAYRWQSLRGEASTVAGKLRFEAMPANGLWFGPAAMSYRLAIRPQCDAAARITTVADATATALATTATAGAVFYAAVAVVVVKLLSGVVTAIGLMRSGVLTTAAIARIIADLGITRLMLGTAVTAMAGLLATQAGQLTALHGEAVDNSAFPGGAWPSAVTRTFADATVTDGDADWSLQPR